MDGIIFKQVSPYGVVELTIKEGEAFIFNGQRLKHYFGGNIEKARDKQNLECTVSSVTIRYGKLRSFRYLTSLFLYVFISISIFITLSLIHA